MNSFIKRAAVMVAFFVGVMGSLSVSANGLPRTDMIDISNHNGYISQSQFRSIRDNYGVKAVTQKISEGSTFYDWTAATNLANAKAAGLYINGYHFSHFTDNASAKSEAYSAVQFAKKAGLPVEAVLVNDAETPLQMNNNSAVQQEANATFEREVMRLGGYRSITYGMGSRVDIVPGKGWIASYPYYPDGSMKWHSEHHAWQWSSTYQFVGLVGSFDVNMLYTDFFTANQDVKNNSHATSKPNKSEGKDTAAIREFKRHNDQFYITKSIRVDKMSYVNGMWQMVNYNLAGGTDFNWTNNGIPLAMVNNITRGNYASTRVGDYVQIKVPLNYGTIDQYHNRTNGIGIDFGIYGRMYMNAQTVLAL